MIGAFRTRVDHDSGTLGSILRINLETPSWEERASRSYKGAVVGQGKAVWEKKKKNAKRGSLAKTGKKSGKRKLRAAAKKARNEENAYATNGGGLEPSPPPQWTKAQD